MNISPKKLPTPLNTFFIEFQAFEAKPPRASNTPLTMFLAPSNTLLKKPPIPLNTFFIEFQAFPAKLPSALKTFATTFLTPLNIPA